jgi:hypothetical protein
MVKNIKQISIWAEKNGVTHLLLVKFDIDFFILGHDQTGAHYQAWLFLNEYISKCSVEVFSDDGIRLFQLTTDSPLCQ